MFIAFNAAKALPVYYCGQYGNTFAISWVNGANGQLTFVIQAAGTCTGGPYTLSELVRANQEGMIGGITEASKNEYDYLSFIDLMGTQSGNVKDDYDSAVAIAPSVINYTFNYVDPDKISLPWSQQLAANEGKSIYALTLSNQPFTGIIKFNIWSVGNQNVVIKLIDINNGSTAFQSTLSISDGKNEKEKVYYNSLKGTYLLTITSNVNVISRTVTLQ